MLTNEKTLFTKLKADETFCGIIRKLYIHNALSEDEKIYILSLAIVFLQSYEQDRRHYSYAEFSYFLILHYTVITSDIEPLYDFSVNFGFYPISDAILKNQEQEHTFFDGIIQNSLANFKNQRDNYIETLEQHIVTNKVLEDDHIEKGYIAPTSFGKSSLMTEIIKRIDTPQKIAIIVPTKSLLVQTYKNIVESDINKKIILHDGMYNGEDNFVAILTQERALRMIDNHEAFFDILLIDEAHNIFDMDQRSLLLTRLIKKNYSLNNSQKVYYFSPLIKDVNNIRINNDINSYNIKFNIKEPVLYEFKEQTKEIFLFNRFLGEFQNTDNTEVSWIDYIISASGNKKFIYQSSPQHIEALARELQTNATKINDIPSSIEDLKSVLVQQVHEKFYLLDTIDYGIVYLHGKMPDLIKEYLEKKFKEIDELKYLVANNVILEGINLPIDALFISSYYKLDHKKITNLIGRVNRLNYIFGYDRPFDVESLIPKIHFLHDDLRYEHLPKLRELRGKIFDDHIKNPMLDSFDIEKELKTVAQDSKQKFKDKIEGIQSHENFLMRENSTRLEKIKKDLIRLGINMYYANIDLLSRYIESLLENPIEEVSIELLLEKIHSIFFNNTDNITDNELKRLNYPEARNYYTNYILVTSKKSLKNNIVDQFEYLIRKSISTNPLLYIGSSFGEIPYPEGTLGYPEPYRKVYIDLRGKSEKYLINIAIAKIKIEEDFISYALSKFVEFLYEYNFISLSTYNKFTYGTDNEFQLKLTKTGLSISLISRLIRDEQLENVYFDDNNNLCANSNFRSFLSGIDDFYKFEIERHLIG